MEACGTGTVLFLSVPLSHLDPSSWLLEESFCDQPFPGLSWSPYSSMGVVRHCNLNDVQGSTSISLCRKMHSETLSPATESNLKAFQSLLLILDR